MPDPLDAKWLDPVRDALARERRAPADPLPALAAKDHDRLVLAALGALGARDAGDAPAVVAAPKSSKAQARAWARWAVPVATFAAAAALLVALRRPAADDAFAAYRVEISGVESMRGAGEEATTSLAVADGAPFRVVLRPESAGPAPHAYAFLRSGAAVREADAKVEVAPSGAALVSGDGKALADADELVVVLTRRAAVAADLATALSEKREPGKVIAIRIVHAR